MKRLPALLILSSLIFSEPFLAAETPASPASAKSAGATVAKKKEDLPNFHEVHPYLFRSGEPSETGLAKLKDMGVKKIIDLRSPGERKFDEKKAAEGLGMEYLLLTMSSKAPSDKQVDTVISTISQARDNPESGKVLVHCAHGSDRTGCMIGIWRVTQEGWSYEDAYKEMRKYWFTPKFTELSGAVEKRAKAKS